MYRKEVQRIGRNIDKTFKLALNRFNVKFNSGSGKDNQLFSAAVF